MATMTIEQAGKAYKVIQSNNGVRLEFLTEAGTFEEVFRHWPDTITETAAPTGGPITLPFNVETT